MQFYARFQDEVIAAPDTVSAEYLKREELLRGFVEGYSSIHHDETRHIGYGVGVSVDDVRNFALTGLTRRLDIIGVPLASLQEPA